jgi:hypothetical protein
MFPPTCCCQVRLKCWAYGVLKSVPQPMKMSPGGKSTAPPLTAASGLANVSAAGGALISSRGVNGGASTPFWKKSPWPASAS